MSNKSSSFPKVIIKPKQGWQSVDWGELIKFKDLFYFLISRDIKSIYKQTVLGFSWAIIRPTFAMIVFSVIFGGLAKIPSDNIPYQFFFHRIKIEPSLFTNRRF